MWSRLFAVSLGLALLAGCGPVQSTAVLMDADTQLEAARAAGASDFAPYEYTLAGAYLHKSRELQGYADYDVSIDFAQKALDAARKAKQLALQHVKESGTAPTTPALP